MKKTTLSVFLLLSTAFVFAKDGKVSQLAGSNGKPELKSTGKTIAHVGQSSARVGLQTNQINAAFFTEDFSSGIPAGWTNVDAAGNGVVWTATSAGAANGDTMSTVGTSAANGYVIFDSDGSGASVGGEDGILTSSAIDCSGKPLVVLSLNEYFAQYVASTAVISVSNDGTTWTEVHHAETGLAQNEATPNPNAITVDISAVAGNQAAVYIRFEYIGDWDYYWMIDDVTLSEPAGVDAALIDLPLDFNGCSLSATTPVSVEVENLGADPIMNFDISYSADGGTPVTETYTDTLNFGETAVYTFTSTVDLSAAGVHQIDAWIGIAGDGDLTNDTLSVASISYDHIDLTAGAYTMGFEASEDFTAYTLDFPDGDPGTFDISPDYTHSGIACLRKVGTGVADDKWVFTQCVDILAGGVNTLTYYYKNFELATPCSLEVYIGASNTVADMTTLVVQNPIPGDTTYQMATAALAVTPGTYTLGFHFYQATGAGTSSLRIDDISIDFNDGINENIASSLISVYPNPSNGQVNISNKNTTEKNFKVSVINSLGEVVLVKNFENLTNETIDLSSQPAGIYSVKLQSASTTVNKSVVIAK